MHMEKWMKVETLMYIMKKHMGTYDHVVWQGIGGTLRVTEGTY